MKPTEALRARLRKLLNERIPSEGTEEDTNFLGSELDDLLLTADSIYTAASLGWSEKAALLQGDIEQYSAGAEQYRVTSLKDKLAHALSMAQQYKEMSPTGAEVGNLSMMLKVKRPDVL